MTKKKMISVLVENYKKTLNPKSKWFTSDLNDYKRNLDKLSIEQIKVRYNKSVYQNSKEFDNAVKKYVDKMDKSGMFNLNYKR